MERREMKVFLPGMGILDCKNPKTCTWKEDEDGNWQTKCGKTFVTNYGGPKDNGFKFCCFCGNKLRQIEYKEKS